MEKILSLVCALALLGAGCVPAADAPEPAPVPATSTPALPAAAPAEVPLERAGERITKKPFGLRVTPQQSPVQPERFSGYHAGVDFETFDDEQGRDVIVHAICDGELVLKKEATGYGGLAVQRCMFEDEPVTVIYGHLNIYRMAAETGEFLQRGERLGLLGEGFGPETDGERKHLHLGVHRGEDISLLGYVQDEAALSEWLDVRDLLAL